MLDDTDFDALEKTAKLIAKDHESGNFNHCQDCIDYRLFIAEQAAAIDGLRKEVSEHRVRELRDEELIADLRRSLDQLGALRPT